MTQPTNEQTSKNCDCGEPLYRDWTNRGRVVRCRNPSCPVDEIEYFNEAVVDDGTDEAG